VLNQVHVPGEMRNFGQAKGWMNEERLECLNTSGRLGNIKGRPNQQDLLDIAKFTKGVLTRLELYKSSNIKQNEN
jgi:hypothetical protein